jgi:aspartokinase-like uncharacterized kinase
MNLDAVLKVGGSLSRGSGLKSLCREIYRLGETYRLLVVPGGGRFADQVRMAYRRFGLNETTAHCMALLAMDQYGYVLNHLIRGSVLISDPASACSVTMNGKVSILLPSRTVLQQSMLPHSWEVTSDSIAAWVAHRAQCRRLVLLKDVDGLFAASGKESDPELIEELTGDQLARHNGGLDEYLGRYLATIQLEAWVVNGQKHERLVELLQRGYTTGTRLLCS